MEPAGEGFVPYPETFATEAATAGALERLREILETGDAQAADLRLLIACLVVNPEQFPRFRGRLVYDSYRAYVDVLARWLLAGSQEEAIHGVKILGRALRQELLLGWINLDKVTRIHHSLVAFRRLSEREELRPAILGELLATVVSHNPLVSIDVRGEAADLLVALYRPQDFALVSGELGPALESWRPLGVRSLREHVLAGTDTIDTPFDYPLSPEGRMRALWESAVIKVQERSFLDVMRIVRRLAEADGRLAALYAAQAPKKEAINRTVGEYLSHPDAEAFIAARLSSETRQVEDYVVNPNQQLGRYTVSDLTRLMSLSPEAYWPDRRVRAAWTGFVRSVLGFSKVANIGLGSKMVYIPHGFDIPSLVYVGQATVVGKGATIDLTGGVVIGARNYTSSFWSDTSLHGHLHVGDDQRGIGGTLSRLAIEPYIMMLDDDIAFPPGLGYLEAAHYAAGQRHAGEITGFRAVRAAAKAIGTRL